jgi:putative membrane protein
MIVAQGAKLWTLPGYVGRSIALIFAFDVVVAVAYVFAGWTWLSVPDIPVSVFGGVIGVLAGFRNSSAYARWWEARTIWGGVVNSSRTFAREVLSMIADGEDEGDPAETKRRLVRMQIAYVHALRHHLRGSPPWDELGGLLGEAELDALKTRNNVPLAIQQRMAVILSECYRRGWIDDIRWAALDRTLSTLMDCQGASERIKNTPMPRLYDLFIRLFIRIYCVLLPLGMVASLKLLTPFGSTLVGFMFLALDQIGRDLETPFDNPPHDIALTSISRTIEINLKQMLGEADVPEPVAAIDGVLS